MSACPTTFGFGSVAPDRTGGASPAPSASSPTIASGLATHAKAPKKSPKPHSKPPRRRGAAVRLHSFPIMRHVSGAEFAPRSRSRDSAPRMRAESRPDGCWMLYDLRRHLWIPLDSNGFHCSTRARFLAGSARCGAPHCRCHSARVTVLCSPTRAPRPVPCWEPSQGRAEPGKGGGGGRGGGARGRSLSRAPARVRARAGLSVRPGGGRLPRQPVRRLRPVGGRAGGRTWRFALRLRQ